MHGMLLIHKPAGISSFGVIATLQNALLERARTQGQSLRRRDLPKFGHGGTLDPFATGLLLVCVGDGTKLSRYLLGSEKDYRGKIRFGETTVPGDPTDPISERTDILPRSLAEIQRAADSFLEAPYLQTPPMHSAKKVDGKRLYELAHQGVEIEREACEVRILEFEVSSFELHPELAHPIATADYRVRCSSGTYIRVLGQDLGRRLGSLAMLETLERTGSGRFHLENALPLDTVAALLRRGEEIDTSPCFVELNDVLSAYPSHRIAGVDALQIRMGQTRAIRHWESAGIAEFAAANATVATLMDDSGALVAVFSRNPVSAETPWKLDRVFL